MTVLVGYIELIVLAMLAIIEVGFGCACGLEAILGGLVTVLAKCLILKIVVMN